VRLPVSPPRPNHSVAVVQVATVAFRCTLEGVAKSICLLTLCAALIAPLACTSRERLPSETRTRKVEFDNVYGKTSSLTIHVTVDGGREQTLLANCGEKTCGFEIPLTNGPHTVLLSVEQGGKRSTATTVNVDTSNLP
jgi:hypothetical protein